MKKIFGFFDGKNPNAGSTGIAINEDGIVLASHWSSNEGWCQHDLGMDGFCVWHHDEYKKHHPDGYNLEFVSICDQKNHEGLQSALKKNKEITASQVEK